MVQDEFNEKVGILKKNQSEMLEMKINKNFCGKFHQQYGSRTGQTQVEDKVEGLEQCRKDKDKVQVAMPRCTHTALWKDQVYSL